MRKIEQPGSAPTDERKAGKQLVTFAKFVVVPGRSFEKVPRKVSIPKCPSWLPDYPSTELTGHGVKDIDVILANYALRPLEAEIAKESGNPLIGGVDI
ncbi:MAG TPA: hypothetical protein VFW15_03620 [Thermoanaerobaculia bacterium]|nr:hypothetical protein [Thermoanaerobaculia bacterium]